MAAPRADHGSTARFRGAPPEPRRAGPNIALAAVLSRIKARSAALPAPPPPAAPPRAALPVNMEELEELALAEGGPGIDPDDEEGFVIQPPVKEPSLAMLPRGLSAGDGDHLSDDEEPARCSLNPASETRPAPLLRLCDGPRRCLLRCASGGSSGAVARSTAAAARGSKPRMQPRSFRVCHALCRTPRRALFLRDLLLCRVPQAGGLWRRCAQEARHPNPLQLRLVRPGTPPSPPPPRLVHPTAPTRIPPPQLVPPAPVRASHHPPASCITVATCAPEASARHVWRGARAWVGSGKRQSI